MTKNDVKQLLEIAKNTPVVLYGDNMVLAQLNMENGEYLLGDSALWCIRANRTTGPIATSQQVAPFEILNFPYDQIQYAKLFPITDMLSDTFKYLKEEGVIPINDEAIDDVINRLMSNSVLKATFPIGTDNNLDSKISTYGTFRGPGVSVGGRNDKYLEKVMNAYNEKNQSPVPPEPTP